LGWSNAATVFLAVAVAFLFGYLLTIAPVLRSGLALRAAPGVAFRADTNFAGQACTSCRHSPIAACSWGAAVAAGELEAWSGRFLRAGADDLDVLRCITPEDAARQLRLRPYGDDDPLV
jgi:hypothetical protein